MARGQWAPPKANNQIPRPCATPPPPPRSLVSSPQDASAQWRPVTIIDRYRRWDYLLPDYGFRKPFTCKAMVIAFEAQVPAMGYGVYLVAGSPTGGGRSAEPAPPQPEFQQRPRGGGATASPPPRLPPEPTAPADRTPDPPAGRLDPADASSCSWAVPQGALCQLCNAFVTVDVYAGYVELSSQTGPGPGAGAGGAKSRVRHALELCPDTEGDLYHYEGSGMCSTEWDWAVVHPLQSVGALQRLAVEYRAPGGFTVTVLYLLTRGSPLLQVRRAYALCHRCFVIGPAASASRSAVSAFIKFSVMSGAA